MTGLCGCINVNVAFNSTSLSSRLAGLDGNNFPRVNARLENLSYCRYKARNFRKSAQKIASHPVWD